MITAGNFPVAVPSWYLVPALLMRQHGGVEAGRIRRRSAMALFELLRGGRAARRRAEHRVRRRRGDLRRAWSRRWRPARVDKIGFTGSTEVGARIGELAGRHLQSPCLELGGKNPMVVTPSADLELAVEGALFSGFGTAGQRCTSLGTVIVHESVHDEFLARFDTAVSAAADRRPGRRTCSTGRCWTRSSPTASRSTSAGSSRTTRSSARPRSAGSPSDNPRAGFVGDPERAVLPPGDRGRRAAR